MECALLVGLKVMRRRFAGVLWRFTTAGDSQLWRPVKGLIGDEIRYSASPGGPRISGEELWLRDVMDIADSVEGDARLALRNKAERAVALWNAVEGQISTGVRIMYTCTQNTAGQWRKQVSQSGTSRCPPLKPV